MPLVIISRKREVIDDKDAAHLAEMLQGLVAQLLDVPENPDARLTEDDIEVRVREPGPLDRNASNLAIEIIASDYPERRVDLQRSADTVADVICHDFPHFAEIPRFGDNNFVWIILAPAGFATI